MLKFIIEFVFYVQRHLQLIISYSFVFKISRKVTLYCLNLTPMTDDWTGTMLSLYGNIIMLVLFKAPGRKLTYFAFLFCIQVPNYNMYFSRIFVVSKSHKLLTGLINSDILGYLLQWPLINISNFKLENYRCDKYFLYFMYFLYPC